MRLPALLLAAALSPALAAAATDTPTAAVEALFDALKTHDAAAARALALPDATLLAVREGAKPTITTFDKFAERLGAAKDVWLERMWNPKVLERGPIATVWAEYDFHVNGKFQHCGVDSVSLLKTADGWKIASISYTVEKSGCSPSPLGPPPAN